MQEHLNYMTDLYLMNKDKMDRILDIIEGKIKNKDDEF